MFKGPMENEMADAWGRRIARDWPLMPVAMQALFMIGWGFQRASHLLGWVLLLASMVVVLWVASGSYLFGGNSLISNHPLLPMSLVLFFCAVCFRWLMPGVVNLMVNIWYYKTRANFQK